MTLAQVTDTLGSYIEPGGNFMASLNQVLSRLYGIGTYRDLTVQYSLPVIDGAVTLPDDAASILHTMVDGFPVPVRSLWHDFKSVGTNSPVTDAEAHATTGDWRIVVQSIAELLLHKYTSTPTADRPESVVITKTERYLSNSVTLNTYSIGICTQSLVGEVISE